MVIENRDQQYREVAYHLLQNLYMSSGADHTIATLGFLIALSKKGRLFDYMEISKFDYIFHETIQLDDTTAVSIYDVSRLTPTSHDVFGIIRILDTITDLDHTKLFEEIIHQYYAHTGKRAGEYSQPQELTHLVSSILNENLAQSVYNPFAGIGSYQLDNKEVDYYSQEINRNTWLIGKLRMYINGISCEYSCEDSLLRWEGENRKFDAVVATPPFKMQLTDEQRSLLYWEDLGFRHRTVESLYFSRSITSVKDGGVIIGVVPMGFLFDSTPAALGFRQYLLNNGLVQEVIQLPSNIFSATSINTAIIVLSKRENTSIRFIDASECFTQSGRLNILDEERVANLRKNGNSANVRNISVNEVVEQNCDLTPSRYLEEEEALPDGFNLIHLKDVVTTVRGERTDIDVEGVCLNIGDLSADGLNCILDINSLQVEKTKNNFRRITSPVLLLSKVRVLKPTYIEASESMPIYISPNVMALEVDTTKITIPYLAYELSLKSDKLHRGAIIPNFRPNDILNLTIKVPALSSQQDVLSQEKVMVESLILADKNAKIKEHGLEEIVKLRQQEFEKNMRTRRHAMNQVLNGLSSAVTMAEGCVVDNQIGNHIVAQRTGETLESYMRRISLNIKKLEDMVGNLLIENKYGIKSKECIEECILLYQQNHLCGNYIIEPLNWSYEEVVGLNEDGIEEIVYIDQDGGGSDTKPGTYVEIARDDLFQVFDNIIDNAKKYGFSDYERKDYAIRFDVDLVDLPNDKLGVAISISNNGDKLSRGITASNIFDWGKGNGSGIGAWQVKEIVEHYGGKVEFYQYPNDPFGVGYNIILPYSPIEDPRIKSFLEEWNDKLK